MNELIIDETNFNQYFFDVRTHKPQKDQILAKYTAIAELGEGMMKKHIIDLVKKDKAIAATQVLRKLGCASEKDCLRICKEICQDLISGIQEEDIEKKNYRYTAEFFYYTQKEFVPLNDPHWSMITISNLEDFLDATNNQIKMKTEILNSAENRQHKG